MEDPIESAELMAFVQIVDARSLSRAALELRVPRATIGRRLQRLEQRLGVRLLRRTTRSLVLTDAGEAFYRHACIALDAVKRAAQSVHSRLDDVRGELRVSVVPFTNPLFHAMVVGFLRRYPNVRLSLHFSTEHVDLLRDGFDLAVRGSSVIEPGMVARVLTRSTMIAVASPEYLSRHPPLRSVRDLRAHTCLAGFARGELPQTHWVDAKKRRVQVAGQLAANDLSFLSQAAVDGLGIAYLPRTLVKPALERGELVQVLKGTLEGITQLAVVYPERELLAPQVRAFVDTVIAWAREHGDAALWPSPPASRKRSG